MELLKKWLDGSINWKEEKQLRNQAKKDEFLADALEGLDAAPELDHPQKIHALHERLQERIGEKNKRSVFPLKAIAAAAMVLLSVGIWWNIQNNLNQPTIADKQIQSTPPSAMTKTIAIPQDKMEEEKTAVTNGRAVVQEELSTTSLSNDPQVTTKSTKKLQETVAMTNKVDNNKIKENTPTTAPISNPLKEATKTIDESEEKIVMGTEVTNIKTEERPLESSPNIEEEADAIVFVDKIVEASPESEIIAKDQNAMSPPPSDMGVISAVAPSAPPVSRAAKRRSLNSSHTFPIGGIEAFQEYIKTYKRYPEEAKADSIKGTVHLYFNLKKDGSVKKVRITKKLHPACDAEAIRLIKEGPKWISPNGIVYWEIDFGLE